MPVMLTGQIFYYYLLDDKNDGQIVSDKVKVETFYQPNEF